MLFLCPVEERQRRNTGGRGRGVRGLGITLPRPAPLVSVKPQARSIVKARRGTRSPEGLGLDNATSGGKLETRGAGLGEIKKKSEEVKGNHGKFNIVLRGRNRIVMGWDGGLI